MMFDLILDVMNGFSAKIGSIVPLDGAIFLIIPGASCLASGASPQLKRVRRDALLTVGKPSRLHSGATPQSPGTSCLATIVLSLQDKIHSTAEAIRPWG
jgi:hypothetical protein